MDYKKEAQKMLLDMIQSRKRAADDLREWRKEFPKLARSKGLRKQWVRMKNRGEIPAKPTREHLQKTLQIIRDNLACNKQAMRDGYLNRLPCGADDAWVENRIEYPTHLIKVYKEAIKLV